jgi:exonuclease SbcD
VFSGNLQGRHVRETGPKGATLVTVADQRVVGLEALALDAARWETVTINLGTCSDERSCHEVTRSAISPIVDACEGRPLCMRLRFTGRTALHAAFSARREQFAEDIQAVAYGVSDQVFVERVILDTALPAATPALSLPFADLQEAFETVAANADFGEALKAHLSAIRDKAPREVLALLPEGGDGPPVQSVIASARDLILSRLAVAGSDEGEVA